MSSERVEGMVGVEEKKETLREARATAKIKLSTDVINRIKDKTVSKGDVLEQSRLAGIMAAKRTHELIPLCHPLRITNIKINFDIVDDGIKVESFVSAIDRTGVEMEALLSAATACLNIYDMCKKYGRSMTIQEIYLLEKKGGKSGHFSAEVGKYGSGEVEGMEI